MFKGYQGDFPGKSFCKLSRRRKCKNEQSAITLPGLPVFFQHITCAQVGNKCGLTSAQFGRRCISFYSQLGNNFAHVLYALQIGKQCKPVQVHLFTKIPPEEKFSQIACWGSIPNPLWTPPAVSAAHSFWILLLTDFCAICIEVQFSINEKMKTWEKLSLIIYVICGNPLPNKLSGSLVGNSPTSNESGNARIPLHPKLGWKTSCQLDTKLKMQETETKITST